MFTDKGEDITCFFLSEGDFVGDHDSFMAEKPSRLYTERQSACA
jgi:hypothetical protein